jgi:hypothetical protein
MTKIKTYHSLEQCDVKALLKAARMRPIDVQELAEVTEVSVYNWRKGNRFPLAIALAMYSMSPFRGHFGTPTRKSNPTPVPSSLEAFVQEAEAIFTAGQGLPWLRAYPAPGASVPVPTRVTRTVTPPPVEVAEEATNAPFDEALRVLGYSTLALLETQRTLKGRIGVLEGRLTEARAVQAGLEEQVKRLTRDLEEALDVATRPETTLPSLDQIMGEVSDATRLSLLVPVPELSFTPEAEEQFAQLRNNYRQTVLSHLCRFGEVIRTENVSRALQPVETMNKLRTVYPQEKLWKFRAGREMRVILERLSETEYRVLGIHKKSEKAYFSDAH